MIMHVYLKQKQGITCERPGYISVYVTIKKPVTMDILTKTNIQLIFVKRIHTRFINHDDVVLSAVYVIPVIVLGILLVLAVLIFYHRNKIMTRCKGKVRRDYIQYCLIFKVSTLICQYVKTEDWLKNKPINRWIR